MNPNQPLVLVLANNLNDPRFEMLKDLPHVIGDKAETFAQATADASVILNWSGSRDLASAVFHMCPGVHWVHSRTAGIDTFLFPELLASDIPLTNGSGVFSQSLGEFVLGVMLYFAKDFRRMIRNQEAGRWEQFVVEEIAGQTVGIVGYGDIGRAVATRAHAIGMRVLALKRHPPAIADPLVDEFFKPDELAAMLGRCDCVVVSAPLTRETRHMISDPQFESMKPSAVIINVGRGPVIDQAALVRALTEKKIRGAGLDVFEYEPIPEGDPIYKLENVLLSPHCADQTKDWMEQSMQFFLRQYKHFSDGEPLKNVVKKKLGY